MKIVLTVQPVHKKKDGIYRLYIGLEDSFKYFKERQAMVCLYLDEPDPICVKTTCGINKKKGFDLSSEEINKWIIKNNFDKYEHRNPTKLGFEYHLNGSVHVLKYLYPLYK